MSRWVTTCFVSQFKILIVIVMVNFHNISSDYAKMYTHSPPRVPCWQQTWGAWLHLGLQCGPGTASEQASPSPAPPHLTYTNRSEAQWPIHRNILTCTGNILTCAGNILILQRIKSRGLPALTTSKNSLLDSGSGMGVVKGPTANQTPLNILYYGYNVINVCPTNWV